MDRMIKLFRTTEKVRWRVRRENKTMVRMCWGCGRFVHASVYPGIRCSLQ